MEKKIALLLVTILLIIGIELHLFSQAVPVIKRQSKKYLRLTFWIQQESVESYFEALNQYGTRWDGKPKLHTILDNMEKCFYEAKTYYDANKKKLPACLWMGLDRLFDELNKPGRPLLHCAWYKYPDVPWRYVYKQEFNLVEAEANGMAPSKQYIYLINVWKNTYEYTVNGKVQRTVKTSSILMHELIHCVKKHYPDCFRELTLPKEEGTTEGGEIFIYGKSNCGTSYRDINGWSSDCTYENVCECKKDCPDKDGNIIK